MRTLWSLLRGMPSSNFIHVFGRSDCGFSGCVQPGEFCTGRLNRRIELTFMSDIRVRTLLQATAVEQCLVCCDTNRKVAGSIPAGVSGFSLT